MTKQTVITVVCVLAAAVALMHCSPSKTPESIAWMTDIDQGLALAADNGKPVMVDFMATWCPPCHKMEDSTFSQKAVIEKAKQFITVRIDVDQQGEIANQYNGNASKYGGVGIPNILFLDSEGNELKHPVGYLDPEQFLAIMDSVLVLNKK